MADNHYFDQLEEILKSQNRPEVDIREIESAYKFAERLHANQFRISEEPYIIHPVEVAKILSELRVDKNTILAALLHDILEDTDTQPEEIEEKFGSDVLNLVLGVTKLGKYHFKSKEERQAENFRKMFIAMANDIRVIFLKLADRLHNMRTLGYMAQNKQVRIAQETLDIFVPLANRLGIGKIKAELEDLSLRYLNPEKYFEIAQLVALKKNERETTVNLLIDRISAVLKQNGIKAKIQGRAKHYYSIYSKMKRLNIAFHDLYDITAVRVIVENENECYEVLGIIHSQFKPIPGRFKDYIAMPKGNLYRSLHTSVIGPHSKPLEVQIRTTQMHEVAEYGVAAHWKYKEVGSKLSNSEIDMQFSWMRKMAEMERDIHDASDFVESVKFDLFADQVFAFTPLGDVIDLPAKATPVDFAFRIHSDVGSRTTGALVNGRIAQLDSKLKNGDIVEILTSKTGTPKLDWLNFVVTKQAQSKIKQWFKKNKKEDHITLGKTNMEVELTKAVFDEYLHSGEFERVAKLMNYRELDDLFAAIGYGETTVQKVVNKLKRPQSEDEKSFLSTQRRSGSKGDIVGLDGMLYTFAKCCTPVPGEPIVGIVTRTKGVSIHRIDCPSIDQIPTERLMDIAWADGIKNKVYTASIRVDAEDKLGMLKDILTAISDINVNITSANLKSSNRNVGVVELSLQVDGIMTLRKVIQNIQSIPEVYSVKRIAATSKAPRVYNNYKKKK